MKKFFKRLFWVMLVIIGAPIYALYLLIKNA